MAGTPDELVGTADAPWRRWAETRGCHPVDVLLTVQQLYREHHGDAAHVPRHPLGLPLRLRHLDERTDQLRPLIVEAVERLTTHRRQGAA